MDFKDIFLGADHMSGEEVKPGFRRAMARWTMPGYTVGRVIKKIAKGDSLGDAIIHEGKEIICEDTPGLNLIYDAGKFDGKKEGYQEASGEYEKKICELTNMFLAQNKVHKQQEDEYNKLLDEYDILITQLTNKVEKTEAENKNLMSLLAAERKLRKLSVVK